MSVDLGKWGWLAGPMIDFGAPILGSALGMPSMADPAARLLKKALGLPGSASPEDVQTTINSTQPDQLKAAVQAAENEASEKWAWMRAIVEAQAAVAQKNIETTGNAMIEEARASAARKDGWWSAWRVWNANELTCEFPLWCLVIFYGLLFDGEVVKRFADMQAIVSAYWGLRGLLLGVHLWQGSNERQAAITGQPVGSVLSTVTAAIKKR